MISGAKVGVPVIVGVVRANSNSRSALLKNILFIDAVPTRGRRMPDLEIDLALGVRVGAVGAHVVGEATACSAT
jgi:hypothetical protein